MVSLHITTFPIQGLAQSNAIFAKSLAVIFAKHLQNFYQLIFYLGNNYHYRHAVLIIINMIVMFLCFIKVQC